ncbi:MAG: 50S ribosomal protein L35 [Elusimicrobia bacterium]|nr:50S ribosomal protein L35 [Elusimicrobiota bacterium]
MPKMKSHSGAKKRFRANAAGQFKHEHPGQRHLMAPLGGKRRRCLRGSSTLNNTDARTMRRFLPYA